MLRGGELFGFQAQNRFFEIGTPGALAETDAFLRASHAEEAAQKTAFRSSDGIKSAAVNAQPTWPKILEPLDDEQRATYDDFVKRWHEILPRRYGRIERFNQRFPVEDFAQGVSPNDRDWCGAWRASSI